MLQEFFSPKFRLLDLQKNYQFIGILTLNFARIVFILLNCRLLNPSRKVIILLKRRLYILQEFYKFYWYIER